MRLSMRCLTTAYGVSPSALGSRRIASASHSSLSSCWHGCWLEPRDRWVRYDDWRLEFRHDGFVTARDPADGVDPHARAAVDDAMCGAAGHHGLDSLRLAIRAQGLSRQIPEQPALTYSVEASDSFGHLGYIDLIVAFDFPAADEIEWTAGLNVHASPDVLPPLFPTRARVVQIADRFGAYARITSEYPACHDLVAIGRLAPHLTCTANRMRRALARIWSWDALPAWPLAVPGPPPTWTVPYQDGAAELGLPQSLAVGHAWAAALLDPILSRALPPGATWDPTQLQWVRQAPAGSRGVTEGGRDIASVALRGA